MLHVRAADVGDSNVNEVEIIIKLKYSKNIEFL